MVLASSEARAAANRRSASLLGRVRTRLLGISPDEASFERRGFAPCPAAIRERLESIGRAFIGGYRTALLETRPEPLGDELDRTTPELRGFAFEGAAMGLALIDRLAPWSPGRLEKFVAGPGRRHVYMVHVGAGWTLARLRRRITIAGPLPGGDPLLRWLAADGYGFHEGYFHWPRSVRERRAPERIEGYARRVFDQGLGRSLWFVEGASPERIVATIAAFPTPRRGDLWSGIGLAAAYAGGVDRADLEALRRACGDHHAELAQGAAFAAKARARAGNPAPHTELACRVFCGTTLDEAVDLTDHALEGLPPEGAEPAYETWRRLVQSRFDAR